MNKTNSDENIMYLALYSKVKTVIKSITLKTHEK